MRSSLVSWGDTLHYGASARLTTALTPATTLVSLTAFRALDYEFYAIPTAPSSTSYGRTSTSGSIDGRRRSRSRTSSPG